MGWFKTKTGKKYLLLILCFILPNFGVFAQDAGQELFMENLCHTCHGLQGKTIYPNYPNLAGHDAMYIRNQFLDIQSKNRKSGLTILMNTFPTISKIKPQEIHDIAAHLSKLP